MNGAATETILRADWRRFGYAAPILLSGLVGAAWLVMAALRVAGVLRTGVPGAHAGLALACLCYLLLLEIPRRRLRVGEHGITLDSWYGTRTVAWADMATVTPGLGGWLSVNRQLPAAVVLTLRRGGTQAIPDVFTLRPAALLRLLTQQWQAALGRPSDDGRRAVPGCRPPR